MRNGSKSAPFAWALLLLAGAVSAVEPMAPGAAKSNLPSAAETSANPLHLTLESKLRLVTQLLAQSPAVQRILQSNSTQAKQQLADARAFYAKAQAESIAGGAGAAIQLLDESLRQIALASNLVPDVAQQEAHERSQNAALREAIRTFETLYNSLSSRMAKTNVQTAAVTFDIGRVDGMVEKADDLIVSGKQHEANMVLTNAYRMVVTALNKMLAAATIVYDLTFASPMDEYRYEVARNRSYEELIPIALAPLNAASETAVLAGRYVQRSRDLRDAAQKQATSGEYTSALKTIQDATASLQHSLRIAGVVVPQSTEFTP